jgi:hypothetical protein
VSALGRLALVVDGRRPPGVYRVDVAMLPGTLAAALRSCGAASSLLDTTGVHDKAGFLARCARDLELRPSFGRNWDALADVLRDFEPGSIVLWHGGGALDDDVRSTALEIFAERAAQPPAFTVVLLGAAEWAHVASL